MQLNFPSGPRFGFQSISLTLHTFGVVRSSARCRLSSPKRPGQCHPTLSITFRNLSSGVALVGGKVWKDSVVPGRVPYAPRKRPITFEPHYSLSDHSFQATSTVTRPYCSLNLLEQSQKSKTNFRFSFLVLLMDWLGVNNRLIQFG